MRPSDGTSFLELLVCIAIIAIVAAFAIPGWKQILTTERRSDATATLMLLAARQQQFRLTWNRYAANTELQSSPPAGLGIESTSPGGDYRLAISTGDGGFTATATVTTDGRQARDERCWAFAIDATGRRWATTRTDADSTRYCWKS